MEIIVGGEDVKAAKPSPEGLLLAIKRLHVSKAETLYIGDSTIDAETAQAAGIDFAGITHGVTHCQRAGEVPPPENNEHFGRAADSTRETFLIFKIEKLLLPVTQPAPA